MVTVFHYMQLQL